MHFNHFYQFRNCGSRRISSWDRRGMNQDYIYMKPGQEAVLADIEGAGKINRFYCVIIDPTMLIYRKLRHNSEKRNADHTQFKTYDHRESFCRGPQMILTFFVL